MILYTARYIYLPVYINEPYFSFKLTDFVYHKINILADE